MLLGVSTYGYDLRIPALHVLISCALREKSADKIWPRFEQNLEIALISIKYLCYINHMHLRNEHILHSRDYMQFIITFLRYLMIVMKILAVSIRPKYGINTNAVD